MTAIVSVPIAEGLYDPANEHDACGVGFVAHIKGQKSHSIIEQGLLILKNLDHRGAVGADPLMGDGAGILIQMPDQFYRAELATQFAPEGNPEKTADVALKSGETLNPRPDRNVSLVEVFRKEIVNLLPSALRAKVAVDCPAAPNVET